MAKTFREWVCCKFRQLEALIAEGSGGGGGAYTAGTGLSLAANQFSIDSTVTTNAGTQTLTNKTLDEPIIPAGIFSIHGKPLVIFATSGGGGAADNNYFFTKSANDGSSVTMGAEGLSDANVSLNVVPSGTGEFQYRGVEVGFRIIPSNPQSANYSTVLADSGKSIDHPAADANARAFTIDNALAYPTGTCITFTNMSANACTIALSSGTLYLAGAGTTGTRTIAQYGNWLISGTGLT
jgi:hypothetical protein